MTYTLFSLPLEVLCMIFGSFSPHTSFNFALTSSAALSVFKFNIEKILNQTIEGWGCLIFKCPECRIVCSPKEAPVTNIYSIGMDGGLSERLYRTCRKCRRVLKRENSKILHSLLLDFVDSGDSYTESDRSELARKGISKYEDASEVPGNKDVKYMREILESLQRRVTAY